MAETQKKRSKGARSTAASGARSTAAGVFAALKRALRVAGAVVVAVVQTVAEYVKAFATWAWPRLVRLNAPLVKNPRWLVELLAVPVMFIYLEVMLRLFGGTSLFDGLGFAVLFAVGYGLLVDFVLSFLVKRTRRVVALVVLFLACLLYTVESIILVSFQTYMTFATIRAGTGDVVGNFASTLLSSIWGGLPRIVCFMLPFAVYFAFFWHKNVKRRMKIAQSVELAVLGLVFCLMGAVSAHALANGRYASTYEFDTATKTFGLLTSVRLDIQYSLFGNSAADTFAAVEAAEEAARKASYGTNSMDIDFAALAAEETDEDVAALEEYVASLSASSQNDYTGIFEGKNLILICAEAFSGAVISEELTPTLYRLQHEGIYFSEYYQPAWGGSTSTGEYSFLMGLVPTNGAQSIVDTIGNNNYFTLPNQLQREGYLTVAFHNGVYTYYDRDQTHYNLGFDVWLAYGNGLEDITGENVSDRITMSVMLQCVLAEDEPFCMYFMTMSGHASYVEDSAYTEKYYDYVVSVVGEDTYSDRVMYYLCYQMALEEMLEELVEALEEEGIADDTVICLTTDHYPYGLSESTTYDNPVDYVEELYAAYYGSCDVDLPWDRDRSALILWSGCLEEGGEYADLACEISEPTYSLDIVPTLSNLFGLEYDSRLLVGRDVFSDDEAIVIWANYSWVTVQGKYNASTGTYTPNDGYEYDADYVARINTIVANKVTFSKQVVATDFYGVLFGEDDVGNDGSNGNLITLAVPTSETDASSDDDSADEDE